MCKTFVIISSFIPHKYSIPRFLWGLVLVWELGVLVMDVADACACGLPSMGVHSVLVCQGLKSATSAFFGLL